jgi:sarcosine oxidase subunit beta
MKSEYRIIVVGAGIVGCSIAYHLAKFGENDVLVLEKNYISSGSTGRCAGGIRQQWSSPHNVLLAMRSVKLFERMSEETGFDIEYKQGGYLVLSYDEREATQFEENVKMQRSLGLNVELLTPNRVKQRFEYVNVEKVLLATFCQTDGHANPHLANFAYAHAAKRLGVTILTHTEVLAIEATNSKFTVHTSRGRFESRILVNAAGAYAGQVASMVNVKLPVESYRHQILVTEPTKNFVDPMIISFSGNFYVRQTRHGQFIMGQGDKDEKPGLNYNVTFRFEKDLARKMCWLLPFLGKLRIVRHWSGHYNMSPDAQPIIGESPELANFYYAVGFSGHGFMLAPAVGEALAEKILFGETKHVSIAELNVDRFEKSTVRETNVV